MRVPVLATLVGLLFLQAGSRGQTPAPTVSQPTFRAGTTLVEVSAIVTRGGRPVTDLRADEITVLDNGVAQPIVVFEAVDLTHETGPAQRRDFVLVIDDLHIDPTRTRQAQDVALAFVRALGPHDRLAISNTAGDDVTMDFSTDRVAAEALVRRARGQAPQEASPMTRGASAATGADEERQMRARAAMQVLREVAAAVRSDAAERRAVFLISEGHKMPGDEGRLDDHPGPFLDYLDILRAAAVSNVAIYAVDPRGLQGPPLASAATRNANVPSVSQAVRERFGSLGLLADNTGGGAYGLDQRPCGEHPAPARREPPLLPDRICAA